MNSAGPTLDYALMREPPRRLTLEETDGSVRVIFPVMPKWAYILPIVVYLVVGLSNVILGGLIVRMIWQATYGVGRPTGEQIASARRFALEIFIPVGLAALPWWGFAGYEWRMYHRWGRVPRILTASDNALTLSRLGWWRMREKKWPASEIVAIELRPLRWNLHWKRTAANLHIRRRKGRPLRFRLSSSDPLLPGRIAERLALALNRPLDLVPNAGALRIRAVEGG